MSIEEEKREIASRLRKLASDNGGYPDGLPASYVTRALGLRDDDRYYGAHSYLTRESVLHLADVIESAESLHLCHDCKGAFSEDYPYCLNCGKRVG